MDLASMATLSPLTRGSDGAGRAEGILFLESMIYRLRNTLNGNRPSWSFDPGPAGGRSIGRASSTGSWGKKSRVGIVGVTSVLQVAVIECCVPIEVIGAPGRPVR